VPEPPLWLLLLVLAALVVVFVWGYLRATGRPPTAFQYVPRALGTHDLIQLSGASVSASLWARISRLRIDSVGGSRDLVISLPLAGCSGVVAKGPVKCHFRRVDLGGTPVVLDWSRPVLFCMERDTRSFSLTGDPTLRQGLLVSVGSNQKPVEHGAQGSDCLPGAQAGDMCFQSLPGLHGHLTILAGGEQSIWSLGTTMSPPTCGPGVKMLVQPDPIGSTIEFGVPAQPLRLIATAPAGVFRSSAASVLTPQGRLDLDPGDSVWIRHAQGLCAVVIAGGGSPVPPSPGGPRCDTFRPTLGNGVYVSSPSVVSATRELSALSGPGEQLVESRYQRDPALWLALLGAYLTVVVALVPTLGHRAYVALWRGWSSLRPKSHSKRSEEK